MLPRTSRLSAVLALAVALALLSAGSMAAAASVKVLCENKVFDGFTRKLFVLDTPVDRDPTIQKVFRNCVFRNGNQPAIVISNAQNVLIEGNTFDNIRTGKPGDGVHAINIPCRAPCKINNIIIRNNKFSRIGADGIQMGEESRAISNVTVEGNVFTGSEDVGENGVDIKGVNGPIYVVGNTFQGFRPCESPKLGGRQDCTGSRGVGMVIHAGSSSGPPNGVLVSRNRFLDNIIGLAVSKSASNTTVRGNEFAGNRDTGMLVTDVKSIKILTNLFRDSKTHLSIENTPTSGGWCLLDGNQYLGSGSSVVLKNSTCKKP